MHMLPVDTLRVLASLQEAGIQPILYGSQGVSLYIGAFKKFGDIDLLVEDKWIGKDWEKLIALMDKLGFALQDTHEHEFADAKNTSVAFAGVGILARDGIAQSVDDAVREFTIDGRSIQTLKPEAFLKAYEFSEKDGYRKDVRGKMDREVIGLLNEYLGRDSAPTS